MQCPFCFCKDTSVKDSRPMDGGQSIRRRRICPECGRTFLTYEHIQAAELMVIKRSGKRETFDPGKIQRSLDLALRKCKEASQAKAICASVQKKIEAMGEYAITSSRIGDEIIQILPNINPVAYVRYISVYKSFSNVEDFVKILGALSQKDNQP